MRVYHDELIVGDVRLVMLVPSWFPKAHVIFDWQRVQGDAVSVVFVIRGTMQVRRHEQTARQAAAVHQQQPAQQLFFDGPGGRRLDFVRLLSRLHVAGGRC